MTGHWECCIYFCSTVEDILNLSPVVLQSPGVRPVVFFVFSYTHVVWLVSGSVLSWWCLWYICCCHLVVALPLNSRGTHCCMHPWQTVGPLATNGFFITSRSCQLKELVAQQRRYVCGQVLWSHDSDCHRSAVVSLPPLHVRWIAEPRHRTTEPHPATTSPPLSLLR